VMRTVDAVAVVMCPGWATRSGDQGRHHGDRRRRVVNKADRPGVERAVRDLSSRSSSPRRAPRRRSSRRWRAVIRADQLRDDPIAAANDYRRATSSRAVASASAAARRGPRTPIPSAARESLDLESELQEAAAKRSVQPGRPHLQSRRRGAVGC
jgi:hypothetical protein